MVAAIATGVVVVAGILLLLLGRRVTLVGPSALDELEVRIRARLDATARRADSALVTFCEERQLRSFERLQPDDYEYVFGMLRQQALTEAGLFRAQLDQLQFVHELRTTRALQLAIERRTLEITLGALALAVGILASLAQVYVAVVDRPGSGTPATPSNIATSTTTTTPRSSSSAGTSRP